MQLRIAIGDGLDVLLTDDKAVQKAIDRQSVAAGKRGYTRGLGIGSLLTVLTLTAGALLINLICTWCATN